MKECHAAFKALSPTHFRPFMCHFTLSAPRFSFRHAGNYFRWLLSCDSCCCGHVTYSCEFGLFIRIQEEILIRMTLNATRKTKGGNGASSKPACKQPCYVWLFVCTVTETSGRDPSNPFSETWIGTGFQTCSTKWEAFYMWGGKGPRRPAWLMNLSKLTIRNS